MRSEQHCPLLKRLFKHAEAAGDLAIMARYLVGFDRGVRRKIVHARIYDWQSRTFSEQENLVLQRHGLLAKHPAKHPQAKPVGFRRQRPGMLVFSLATRLYLRRRAWRFYRRLGFQQPDRYVAARSCFPSGDVLWATRVLCAPGHDKPKLSRAHSTLVASVIAAGPWDDVSARRPLRSSSWSPPHGTR